MEDKIIDTMHDALETVILNVREDSEIQFNVINDKLDNLDKKYISLEDKVTELSEAINDLKETVAKELKLDKLIEVIGKFLDRQ